MITQEVSPATIAGVFLIGFSIIGLAEMAARSAVDKFLFGTCGYCPPWTTKSEPLTQSQPINNMIQFPHSQAA